MANDTKKTAENQETQADVSGENYAEVNTSESDQSTPLENPQSTDAANDGIHETEEKDEGVTSSSNETVEAMDVELTIEQNSGEKAPSGNSDFQTKQENDDSKIIGQSSTENIDISMPEESLTEVNQDDSAEEHKIDEQNDVNSSIEEVISLSEEAQKAEGSITVTEDIGEQHQQGSVLQSGESNSEDELFSLQDDNQVEGEHLVDSYVPLDSENGGLYNTELSQEQSESEPLPFNAIEREEGSDENFATRQVNLELEGYKERLANLQEMNSQYYDMRDGPYNGEIRKKSNLKTKLNKKAASLQSELVKAKKNTNLSEKYEVELEQILQAVKDIRDNLNPVSSAGLTSAFSTPSSPPRRVKRENKTENNDQSRPQNLNIARSRKRKREDNEDERAIKQRRSDNMSSPRRKSSADQAEREIRLEVRESPQENFESPDLSVIAASEYLAFPKDKTSQQAFLDQVFTKDEYKVIENPDLWTRAKQGAASFTGGESFLFTNRSSTNTYTLSKDKSGVKTLSAEGDLAQNIATIVRFCNHTLEEKKQEFKEKYQEAKGKSEQEKEALLEDLLSSAPTVKLSLPKGRTKEEYIKYLKMFEGVNITLDRDQDKNLKLAHKELFGAKDEHNYLFQSLSEKDNTSSVTFDAAI
ncbi:hypothetical protein [Fangia hongkongensis]|uniref:hypothetical protein n=1 Tax=Fangia hongkongensis TaxID=270495 RepID=UPI0003783E5A|nr:hypothetical protein [Fangia hongkongensis]MBK2123671.1 hypothetical protein [Fangia hongkongensis]